MYMTFKCKRIKLISPICERLWNCRRNTCSLLIKKYLSPIHTADADVTQLDGVYTIRKLATVWTSRNQFANSEVELRLASCRRCERTRRQSWPSLQFPVLLRYWGWWQSDDTMTSLLKKLPISIKIHVVKPLCSLFGQFPICRLNPSAVVVS